MQGVRYNKVSSSQTKANSCPVYDDSSLTVAPNNEDPYQMARLSPYYKASYTIAQAMFTVYLSLSKPDHKDLHKMGKYELMNKFQAKPRLKLLVMKLKMTLF
jgi:hypothetical protein